MSFLYRIYNLKLTVVVLSLVVMTVALFVGDAVARAHEDEYNWAWFRDVPWDGLGTASLSVVLIAFGYEWYIRRESREILENTISKFEQHTASVVLGEARRVILLDPKSIKELISDSTVDAVVLAALERRTGDPVFARESYDTLTAQLSAHERRCQNYRCKIMMVPVEDSAASSLYYECFVDIRYDAKLLRGDLWFTAVDNIESYNELIFDPSWEARVVRPPTKTYPAGDARAFTVHYARIDNLNLEIERSVRRGVNGFHAHHEDLTDRLGQEVTFQYRYSTMMEKTGHVYMQTVTFPTKNVTMEFEYGLVDIGRVNVFDFFVTRKVPSISTPKTSNGPRSVSVELNGWVFPKSGALFSWVLSSEMDPSFRDVRSLEQEQIRASSERVDSGQGIRQEDVTQSEERTLRSEGC